MDPSGPPTEVWHVRKLPGLEGSIADLGRQEYEFEVRRIRVIYAAIAMAVTSPRAPIP
ncbi:MAG TPA: hypothetical protein VJN96_05345 [Vicinamibacterales bacterium]|nr:hypothetical protein [Vicinamibacterales bacterium]